MVDYQMARLLQRSYTDYSVGSRELDYRTLVMQDLLINANVQFMVLLVLRHTLPIIISGAGDYSLTLFTVRAHETSYLGRVLQQMSVFLTFRCVLQLLMLRTVGILLPIYIMVKAFTAIQRRRHHQLIAYDDFTMLKDPRFSLAASDEESELPQLQQPHSRFIGMH
ncbi:Protein of unknown function DUF3675 - like 1 [Theobroma cacao]|nr:Protein of unknown function DUF3675 - like 1 [Theobroma cacao]